MGARRQRSFGNRAVSRRVAFQPASGIANKLPADLRLELGWYYSEMVGIHTNYGRLLPFHEHEVMPRLMQGAAAFYGPDGKLKLEFRVHLLLYEEFVADLKLA